MFKKFLHLEKLGNTEVEGILTGVCHIFPKLDGTNASVWWDGEKVTAGSRNRQLTLEKDNAGFLEEVSRDSYLHKFCKNYPDLILYGEWLVPHTLKTYRDDAWRNFYVFNVYDRSQDLYQPFETYNSVLHAFGIRVIEPLAIITTPTIEQLLHIAENNTYLIKDGEGPGEGIVIKNYEFRNKYGRYAEAKLVRNEFKEHNRSAFGAPKYSGSTVEHDVVNNFFTKALVDKVHSKIVNEQGDWKSSYIPRLLQESYYDFFKEELWDVVKKMKSPTINFKTLQYFVYEAVKEHKKEVF